MSDLRLTIFFLTCAVVCTWFAGNEHGHRAADKWWEEKYPAVEDVYSAPIRRGESQERPANASDIEHLRRLAHEKGLSWQIRWSDSITYISSALSTGGFYPMGGFEGSAHKIGEKGAEVYIEGGEKKSYLFEDPSKYEVARELWKAIEAGQPNRDPDHSPAWYKAKEKEERKTISGN